MERRAASEMLRPLRIECASFAEENAGSGVMARNWLLCDTWNFLFRRFCFIGVFVHGDFSLSQKQSKSQGAGDFTA
jgi:hypothetical protein